jgi:hypothetical protein
VLVDIKDMFRDPFSNKYLGVVVTVPNSDLESIYVFSTPFTLRKLDLTYDGEFLVNSHILSNIKLSGVEGDSLDSYKLECYLDNQQNVSYHDIKGSFESMLLDLGESLTEGAHDVYIRAISATQ